MCQAVRTGKQEGESVEIPMIQRREIDVLGHMMYIREDFKDAIDLLYNGKINTDKLISQRYSFDKYVSFYAPFNLRNLLYLTCQARN